VFVAHEQRKKQVQQNYTAWVAQQQYAAYVAQEQAIQAQQQQRAREEAQKREWQAHMASISVLGGLLRLTPTQFEMAVVELLKFWGYAQVKHNGWRRDLAAGLVCYDTDPSPIRWPDFIRDWLCYCDPNPDPYADVLQ
jgi:restriction endonuclease Mrr